MTRSRDLANLADGTEFTSADNTKLDGIEASATADQTNAEIKTAVQANSDIALAGNPTTTTQSQGNNSTRLATTAYTDVAIAALADSAPSTLNTLNELAAALGDDANFSTTVTNSIATKLPLAGGTMTGALDVQSTITADGLTVDGNATFNGGDTTIDFSSGTGRFTTQNSFVFTVDDDNNSTSQALYFRANSGKEIATFSETGDISFYEDTGSTAKLFWDASAESLGIGTSSPAAALHIVTPANQEPLTIQATTNGYSYITYRNAAGADVAYTGLGGGAAFATGAVTDYGIRANGNLLFGASSNSERGRFDSSGNFLVSKTASDGAVQGHELRINNFAIHTVDNGPALYARRIGAGANDDGDIQVFQNTDGTVGSIATYGGDLIVGTGDTRLRFVDSLDSILPVSNSTGTSRNAAVDLGHSETAFRDLYLSGGVRFDPNGEFLNDYEEGTHNVVSATGGGGAGTNSAPIKTSYDMIRYTKVGNLVTIQGQIQFGNVSSPSGGVTLSLPFSMDTTSAEGSNVGGGVLRMYNGNAASGGLYLWGVTVFNTSNKITPEWVVSGGTTVPHVPSSNEYLILSFSYMTA